MEIGAYLLVLSQVLQVGNNIFFIFIKVKTIIINVFFLLLFLFCLFVLLLLWFCFHVKKKNLHFFYSQVFKPMLSFFSKITTINGIKGLWVILRAVMPHFQNSSLGV